MSDKVTEILLEYTDRLGRDVHAFQESSMAEYLENALDDLSDIDDSLKRLPFDVSFEASMMIRRNKRRLVQRALGRVAGVD